MVSAMSHTEQDVAAEVRATLARHKRKVDDVAQALKVSRTAASRKVNGHTPFTVTELLVIADLVGVEPAEFFRSHPTPSRAA